MRKKFIVFYHKRPLSEHPFAPFEEKRAVYLELFQRGTERGHEMYIGSGAENFLSETTFRNTYRYEGAIFHPAEGTVTADAIYDRSGGTTFPREENSTRTLNPRAFKLLCNDKNATKKLLSDFMPKSVAVTTSADFHARLKEFEQADRLVLKPAKGMRGEGVLIDSPEHLSTVSFLPHTEYVLQEFVDTGKGITGIVDGYHDLRIVIVNGHIVLAHVRIPKAGSLLANVAQGGSIEEVPLEKIPAFILMAVEKIQAIIDPLFDCPLYSIDFGIQNGDTAFVFELNDQIGFPRETMAARHDFIEGILDSLEKRAGSAL